MLSYTTGNQSYRTKIRNLILLSKDSIFQILKAVYPGNLVLSYQSTLAKRYPQKTISTYQQKPLLSVCPHRDSIIERLRKENEDLLKQDNLASQGHSIDIQQQQTQLELTKKDALIKELKLRIDQQEANDNRTESKFPSTSNDQHENPTIDFEISFPFEDLQNHMSSIYNENKGLVNIISFHGRLNLKTRKVVAVSIGNILKEDKDEDFANSSKDSKV
jgi:hypothetical protein